MKDKIMVLPLIVLCILVFFSYEASAEVSGRDDCVVYYQKEAKCEVAKYIIADACTCKFNSNCRYPSSKAIDCILDNIGDMKDNSAAYMMRNSCIQKYLFTGK